MTSTTSNLHHETLRYKHDGTEFEGVFVYDGASRGRRPGVLLAHAWMGLDTYAHRRAVQIARLGYAVLAIDMYGGGHNAKDTDEAGILSMELRENRKVLRARAQAGLKALRNQRVVESRNLAAIGYSFGGCVALELARDGADLRGVVSFHGLLDAAAKPATKKISAHVLALHGDEDPLVPPKQVDAFRAEMTKAKANWQLVTYGGAVHAFTNPDAGSKKSTGLAYNVSANARSWEAMQAFFKEIFA